jgi:predicted DNA-binding transcriptional regulator AlpA
VVNSQAQPKVRLPEDSVKPSEKFEPSPARSRPRVLVSVQATAPPAPAPIGNELGRDRLLTAEEVADRLNVTKDWVWDHSSRKSPFLPVIRIGDGTLRYRASKIEEFINERERLSVLRRKRR